MWHIAMWREHDMGSEWLFFEKKSNHLWNKFKFLYVFSLIKHNKNPMLECWLGFGTKIAKDKSQGEHACKKSVNPNLKKRN